MLFVTLVFAHVYFKNFLVNSYKNRHGETNLKQATHYKKTTIGSDSLKKIFVLKKIVWQLITNGCLTTNK